MESENFLPSVLTIPIHYWVDADGVKHIDYDKIVAQASTRQIKFLEKMLNRYMQSNAEKQLKLENMDANK